MNQNYRNSDPTTSQVAGLSVNTNALEEIVLDAIRNNHPGTTEEIAAWTELSIVTVSPRMKPLEKKGLVRRTGKRRNSSGISATVWALA